MSIQLRLDAAALAALFPEGSQARVDLQQAVVAEFAKKYIKPSAMGLQAQVDLARKAAVDEVMRELGLTRGEFDRSFAPNRAWAEGWVIANRGFLGERLASAMASNVLGQASALLDEIGDMLEKACEKNPGLLEEIVGFRFPMADECGGLASMCRDASGSLDGKKVVNNG